MHSNNLTVVSYLLNINKNTLSPPIHFTQIAVSQNPQNGRRRYKYYFNPKRFGIVGYVNCSFPLWIGIHCCYRRVER
jgi:hypothetical protein